MRWRLVPRATQLSDFATASRRGVVAALPIGDLDAIEPELGSSRCLV
jgi:hypothetical protein